MKNTMQHHYLYSWITVLSLMAALVLPSKVGGQTFPASSYPFTTTTGTFTELSGGTAIPALQADDAFSPVISLGFSFSFSGKSYTKIKANSNGWISFDTTIAGSNQAYYNNTAASLNIFKPALFPLWDDLSGSGGTASYSTSGMAPDRVFTLEYKHWRWGYNATAPVISFQVKLFERDGKIQFVYRPEAGAVTGNGASIGIGDAAGYLSLNNTTDTATASASVFTAGLLTRPSPGRILQFGPFPDCNTASFPANLTTGVSRDTICTSGPVELSLTTTLPFVRGLTFQWQTSSNGTSSWSNTGIPLMYADTSINISATCYFRCHIFCNGALIHTSTPKKVYVEKPVLWAVWTAPRCGPGSVELHALAPAGTAVSWYDQAAGGLVLGTGNQLTSPYITQTDTFYAAAFNGNLPASGWLRDNRGFSNSLTPNPYTRPFHKGSRNQFLVKASELRAAGLNAGLIDEIGFDVRRAFSSDTQRLTNFSISIKSTTASSLTQWETGLFTVFSVPEYEVIPGTLNNHVFSAPFFWDGNANIVIETCFLNNEQGDNSARTYVGVSHNLGFNASLCRYGDDNTLCDGAAGTESFSTRPDLHFGMKLGCEGPRKAVAAQVLTGPPFVIAYPSTLCHDAIGKLQVTSSTGIYTPITWSPITGLYTDTLATIPYTGGHARTVYFRSSTPGIHTIAVAAGRNDLCTAADTARIWVQPDEQIITAIPDTICISGTSVLSLVPDNGYRNNSIQWQQSTDGLNFTDIPGQTEAVYTTDILTDSRHFKARVSAGNSVCVAPVKEVVVQQPQLTSARDSFRYGPGEVVLEATGNAMLQWYATATGGQPVGSGSPFITPYLDATTTYYVSAIYSRTQPPPTFLSSDMEGGSTDIGIVPYFGDGYANKVQWLLKADELWQADFKRGFITAIGFKVASAGGSIANMSLSLKTTTDTIVNPPLYTGLQQVYHTSLYQPVEGINIHQLQAPFYWDGLSNLILEECQASSSFIGGNFVSTTLHDHPVTLFNNSQNSVADCTPSDDYIFSNEMRPLIQISMQEACESERIPVTATIYPVSESQHRPAPASALVPDEVDGDLRLYPNPTKESATLFSNNLKLQQVQVYNALGQLVYSMKPTQGHIHTIPLSGLAPGIYTVRIGTEQGISTRKLELLK